MNTMRILLRWLLILCVPTLLLSGTIGIAFNSLWVYTAGFAKYSSAAELEVSDVELRRVAQELIAYFNNGHQEYLDINVTYNNGQTEPVYSVNEINHMKDVKMLLWLDYVIALVSATYILGYLGMLWFRERVYVRRELAVCAWRGGIITCGVVIFLGCFAAISFDWLFVKFHEIFFPHGNWQFSQYDNMILMFPAGFWSDAALLIGLVGLVLGTLVAGVGRLSLKRLQPVR